MAEPGGEFVVGAELDGGALGGAEGDLSGEGAAVWFGEVGEEGGGRDDPGDEGAGPLAGEGAAGVEEEGLGGAEDKAGEVGVLADVGEVEEAGAAGVDGAAFGVGVGEVGVGAVGADVARVERGVEGGDAGEGERAEAHARGGWGAGGEEEAGEEWRTEAARPHGRMVRRSGGAMRSVLRKRG